SFSAVISRIEGSSSSFSAPIRRTTRSGWYRASMTTGIGSPAGIGTGFAGRHALANNGVDIGLTVMLVMTTCVSVVGFAGGGVGGDAGLAGGDAFASLLSAGDDAFASLASAG